MSPKRKKLTSAHWGSYYSEVKDNKLIALHPYEKDPNPSKISEGMIDAIDDNLRIRKPYVRKGWYEGYLKEKSQNSKQAHQRKRHIRGKDEFVELSWEEIIEITSNELSRIKNNYSNNAFFAGSYGWGSAGRFHHPQSQLHRFFNCYGGYTKSVNTYSYAASETIIPHVIGMSYRKFLNSHTDWDNICENTELILMFGGLPLKNSQVTSGGVGKHTTKEYLKKCANNKVKFYNISPMFMEADKIVNAEWIKIRPGTDTAFMIAIAYVLETKNLLDQTFLEKYCHGYINFRNYLLGKTDGIIKNPKWAENITGINETLFFELANIITQKRTLITGSWSLQRQQYGEQPHWMIVVLASMIGQIGMPGGGFGLGYSAENGIGNPVIDFKWPALNQFKNNINEFIPVARYSDMLLYPGKEYNYNGLNYSYPNIKLVYWAGGNPFHHQMDLSKLTKASSKPDTIVVNEIWWNSLAKHSDIILPTTTSLERNDIGIRHWDQTISPMHKAIEPIGDSKTDYEIFSLLSEKLDFKNKFTENKNESEWLKFLWNQAEKDALNANFNLPTFDEFWNGSFLEVLQPIKHQILMDDFIKNPVYNPLKTPSKKIEIFSETIDKFGYSNCIGHPSWLEPDEWLGSNLVKKFPLQLISGQPENRLHSQLDNGKESKSKKIKSREALKINPEDASKRKLKNNDIVKVFNERGSCLAGIIISEEVMPGIIFLPTGAWYDPEKTSDFCIHGNPNVLTKDQGCSSLSQGPSAHSTLVEIIKWKDKLPRIKAFDVPKISISISKRNII